MSSLCYTNSNIVVLAMSWSWARQAAVDVLGWAGSAVKKHSAGMVDSAAVWLQIVFLCCADVVLPFWLDQMDAHGPFAAQAKFNSLQLRTMEVQVHVGVLIVLLPLVASLPFSSTAGRCVRPTRALCWQCSGVSGQFLGRHESPVCQTPRCKACSMTHVVLATTADMFLHLCRWLHAQCSCWLHAGCSACDLPHQF